MMREKNICSRFRTRACHGIIIIMAWHNNTDNTVLYIIIRCTTRCLPVVCPLRAQGMCRGAMPCLPVVCPCGCVPRPGEAEEKLWQAWENAGKCGAGGGKCRKKTEKVEKKSLKSLEIRQRALPLQSRSGRGPLGLLRGSGEVH